MKRVIEIGFSKPKGFKIFSLLIRLAESKKTLNPRTWFQLFFASHCFVVSPATKKRPFFMVNEAMGANIRYCSEFFFHSEIIKLYRINVTEDVYNSIKLYAQQYAGAPYSFMENLGILWARTVQMFTGKLGNNIFSQGESAQKCSEYMVRGVLLQGVFSSYQELREFVFDQVAHLLPESIDNVGVRDSYFILEAMTMEGDAVRLK